ncbi:MAG: hypothetical protein WD048_00390 [Chitinophagales bacterium]
MPVITDQKKDCLHCGKALLGRSDKKFCDNYCRSAYNNQMKAASNNYIRNVNNALRKNRRILEQCISNAGNTEKCSREKLLLEGFNFKYYTHTFTNRKGNIYFYCYDFGYLPLENEQYLIVKEQDKKN